MYIKDMGEMVSLCTIQGSILICAYFVIGDVIMAKKPTSVANPFEGDVFQAVVDQVINPDGSIVPVQYLPSPDQVYSLSAEEYADMVDLAEDWYEGDKKYGEGKSMRAGVAKGIKRVLGELPSYAKYRAFQACFIQQMLSTGRTLNETSGEQMWLELIGMVKDTCKPFAVPKSPAKSATRMASKRDKAKKSIEGLATEQLESALADWKDQDNFAMANLAKVELKKREKKALDSNPVYLKAIEELKDKRDSIIADIRKIKQLGDLEQIEALIMPFVPKSA